MIRVKYDKLYVVEPGQFSVIQTNKTETATDDDSILDITDALNNDVIFQGASDYDIYIDKKDNLNGLDFKTLTNMSVLTTKDINEFDTYIEQNFIFDYRLKQDCKGNNQILVRNEYYDDKTN
jgi:hypothetical protein